MNIKIGEKIKILRKRDNITQERLAEVIGVTGQAISKWESGNGYPDIEYITPIANFFNVTTDYLFNHDTEGKRRKIDEYCEVYDAHYREWKPFQERIDMMRQALAEFPAEEKLLMRLAEALFYKWSDSEHGGWVDGKWVWSWEKNKSIDAWQEAVKIMEDLLASSVDDAIRSNCRHLLARLYGAVGEKEKVFALAEKCHSCKNDTIVWALGGRDEDAEIYRQLIVTDSVSSLSWHFIAVAEKTKNPHTKIEAYNIVINLFKFVFSDDNYGFYNSRLQSLYQDYAEALIGENKLDEAFEALENAYNHAKLFDVYLDEIREKGEFQYTSPFVNLIKETSDNIHAVKTVPEFLQLVLKDEYSSYYKELHDDPRYTALINKIEADIGFPT